MTDETAIQALRADHDALAGRVKRLEALLGEQKGALEREMRAGFQGVNSRFDGLEAELRYRFDQLDRVETRVDDISKRLEQLEAFLRQRLNGGERS